MKQTILSKPKFLSLEKEAKQNIIVNIKNNNLDDNDKQITQECILFTEELEKKIKNPSITLQQIKNLFEVYSKKIQAAQ
jgi:hypothetical protein